jgi:hypothetical protein
MAESSVPACVFFGGWCFRRSYWWIILMFDSKLESLFHTATAWQDLCNKYKTVYGIA